MMKLINLSLGAFGHTQYTLEKELNKGKNLTKSSCSPTECRSASTLVRPYYIRMYSNDYMETSKGSLHPYMKRALKI